MNRSLSTLTLRSLVITVVLAAPVCAQNLTEFVNGTPANADQVNTNFNNLKQSIGTINSSIGSLNSIVGATPTTGLQGSVGNLTNALTVTAPQIAVNRRLQFPSVEANRKIVLYGSLDNDHQFSGFGINNSVLRYQTSQGDDHVFYTSTSPTASNELMRIKGNGNVGVGVNPTQRFHVAGGNMRLDTAASSGRFYFGDPGENGNDPIYIDRANPSTDVSHLRLAIGDNPNAAFTDRFEIGTATGASGFTAFATFVSSGALGIGTANPAVALDVVGSIQTGSSGPSSYFFPGNGLTVGSNTSWFASIRASSGIIAGGGYMAASDERAKNIQGRSDAARDLDTLTGIEITDYTYKDTIEKGGRSHKKVIAQAVESVYPQAVSMSTDAVPDIYQRTTHSDGWVNLATDLKVGDRVRLIGEKEQGIHDVLEIRDGAFRTAFVPAGEKVFVYGREVKDFRCVDYEAISMLNVSATQELARKVTNLTTNNEALTRTVAAITTENEALKSSLEAMAAEVAALKAALQPLLAK